MSNSPIQMMPLNQFFVYILLLTILSFLLSKRHFHRNVIIIFLTMRNRCNETRIDRKKEDDEAKKENWTDCFLRPFLTAISIMYTVPSYLFIMFPTRLILPEYWAKYTLQMLKYRERPIKTHTKKIPQKDPFKTTTKTYSQNVKEKSNKTQFRYFYFE